MEQTIVDGRSMLYPLQVISKTRVPTAPLREGRPYLTLLMELAFALNDLFGEVPEILSLPKSRTLTLLYRNATYRWTDVFDAVGPVAVALSDALPLWFYGTTEKRETAEMTIHTDGNRAVVQLRSVSGRPLSHLNGLGIQAELENGDAVEQTAAILAALPYRATCGVTTRDHEEPLRVCGLLEPTPGSLFAYFLPKEEGDSRKFLFALNSEQKIALWHSYLQDGRQPLEFDWLWEHYYAGVFLLEWELTLHMTLENLGFQVERTASNFRVCDRSGQERRFDFTRGGPAEKLFLKLLFPLDNR